MLSPALKKNPSNLIQYTYIFRNINIIGMLQQMTINSSEGLTEQERKVVGVALCVDCLELNDGYDKVECTQVRIREKANKADIMVGDCYRLPKQDEEAY